VLIWRRGDEVNTADGKWIAAAMLSLMLAISSGSGRAQDSAATHEMSRQQATQMLEERYGNAARVVRTDVVEQDGRRLYVFRLLSANGRVWIVRIDAKSGAEVP
jgi:uncharacterized membrane protein YkoI